MFHQNIRLPGVYIFNSNSEDFTPTRGLQGVPIYSTMTNMSIIGLNNTSEMALVLPKYKVIFYIDTGFVGTGSNTVTVDNTSGTKCLYSAGLNGASSCRVYYDNTEIDNVFSTTGT